MGAKWGDAMSMNVYQVLQQNASRARIRLVLSAVSLHPDGPVRHDDMWLATLSPDDAVWLANCSTGHRLSVFTSDGSQPKCGVAR